MTDIEEVNLVFLRNRVTNLQKYIDGQVCKDELKSEINNILDSIDRYRKSEEKTTEILNYFESSLGLLCILNLEGLFKKVSLSFSKMLGYTKKEIIYTPILDLIHPEDIDITNKKIKDLINSVQIGEIENRYRKKNGEYIWFRWSYVVDFDKGRIYGSGYDISAEKRIEVTLDEKKSVLNSIMDEIPDLIFYKDVESIYLGCNTAFEKFVGRKKDQIIGKTDFDLFEDKDLAIFFREKDKNMLNYGKSKRNEEWVEYPNGVKVLLDTLKTPFYSENGEKLGLIGISRDITDLRIAKEASLTAVLDGQEKERKRISQDLHDGLGQILSGMKLSLYSLKSQIDNDFYGRIENMADRAIREYRAVCHDLAPPALSKSGLVDALNEMCISINRNNIEIFFSSECSNYDLKDKIEVELYRVTQELLNNSLKHSNANKIYVKIKVLNSSFEVEVVDDGDGFDLKEAKESKLGIGLENIEARIGYLNGTFTVDSKLGNGTNAKINIPI